MRWEDTDAPGDRGRRSLMMWLLIGGVAVLLAVMASAVASLYQRVEEAQLEKVKRRYSRFDALAEARDRLTEELGREPRAIEIYEAAGVCEDEPGVEERPVVVDLRRRIDRIIDDGVSAVVAE